MTERGTGVDTVRVDVCVGKAQMARASSARPSRPWRRAVPLTGFCLGGRVTVLKNPCLVHGRGTAHTP